MQISFGKDFIFKIDSMCRFHIYCVKISYLKETTCADFIFDRDNMCRFHIYLAKISYLMETTCVDFIFIVQRFHI